MRIADRHAMHAGAFVAAGVLAVHELRYVLAFGGGADARLAHTGHGYLEVAHPIVGTLVAIALGNVLARLAGRGSPRSLRVGPRAIWLLAAGAILAVYAGQELAEGAVAAGHPSGASALIADGGWLALPLALVAGAPIALLLRASAEGALLVATAPPVPHGRPASAVVLWLGGAQGFAGRPIARHLAGRAPPLAG